MARDLDERIFRFSCRMVDVFEVLKTRGEAPRAIAYQLLHAGTAVGANYAEAAGGQTKADFIAKLAIARKESHETIYWLRLINAKGYLPGEIVSDDIAEAREITAILRAIIMKARSTPRRG